MKRSAYILTMLALMACGPVVGEPNENLPEIKQEEPSSSYDHLKELEWLVGDWEDQSEDVDITFSCKWDLYKHFLLQKFTSEVEGQEPFTGHQLIAWDPVKKQVRSWVFDSDGGFGEGLWVHKGDNWIATMTYTLSDGRRASATNIYKKEDQNSYSYASQDRDVEGELLPNIGPVKIVKKMNAQGGSSER